jgi:hypothetical protein
VTGKRLVLVVAGALLLAAAPAAADVAFPARLDVVEREAGVYEVAFSLPIVEGRKLRAEPLLPPTCVEVTPREVGASATGYTAAWSVRCDPASLAGEAILIEGLLGTQTDLAFSLTLRDGRSYSEILRPSRPGFLVPPPPSVASLAAAAALEGARRTLRHLGLWALMVVAALLGARPADRVRACVALAVGYLAAQSMVGQGWLEVSPSARDILLWAAVAAPAVRLAGGGERWWRWLEPWWPAVLLLGLVVGGAQPPALLADGLSDAEQLAAPLFAAAGAGFGALLMALAAGELRALVEGRLRPRLERAAATVLGGLAFGLALAHLSGLVVSPASALRFSLGLLLAAAVAGPALAVAGVARRRTIPVLAVLMVLGAVPGVLGAPLPLGSVLPLATLIVLGGSVALARPLPGTWAAGVAASAVTAHVWRVALELSENVSRAEAVSAGVVVVAVCVLFASLRSSALPEPCEPAALLRLAAAVVVLAAVAWRVAEVARWFGREVATDAALGLIRLPVLALALAALAVLLWPRRRRVADALGLERRSRGWHWVSLGAALLLLPFGTIAVANPFFEPEAPRGDEARRVVSRVLSDTYRAFNLTDEEALYDRLARSVSGELVDEIYLDSRRRLMAGTREGTEVTVRDVGVLEIGEPLDAAAGGGYSYDCRWSVVARVQHLQHVHHRNNIYNGVLTLRADGGRWKITGVELHSEDRVVVPRGAA